MNPGGINRGIPERTAKGIAVKMPEWASKRIPVDINEEILGGISDGISWRNLRKNSVKNTFEITGKNPRKKNRDEFLEVFLKESWVEYLEEFQKKILERIPTELLGGITRWKVGILGIKHGESSKGMAEYFNEKILREALEIFPTSWTSFLLYCWAAIFWN